MYNRRVAEGVKERCKCEGLGSHGVRVSVLNKELIFRTREGRAGCAGGPWGVSFRVSIEGEGGEKGGVREWVCRDVGGSCDIVL